MINKIFSKIYSFFEYPEFNISNSPNLSRIDELERRYKTLLNKHGISTIRRRAMFWAQLAHESNLYPQSENMNYSASRLLEIFPKYFNPITSLQYSRKPEKIANRVYANRMGNGPESSGDGWKYRGHGLIQSTGKDMYIELTNDLKIDLVNLPSLLLIECNAIDAAINFWVKNNINKHADVADIIKVTKIINGGTNGIEDRRNKYIKIYEYLIKK